MNYIPPEISVQFFSRFWQNAGRIILALAILGSPFAHADRWVVKSANGPGQGGLVRTVQSFGSGKLVAAIQGAGVFKSTDGGATWTDISSNLEDRRVRALASTTASLATTELYVATLGGGGVYRGISADGGNTFIWFAVNNGLNCRTVRNLSIQNAGALIYAATRCGSNSGVYRTTDNGANWTLVTGLAGSLFVNGINANSTGTTVRAMADTGLFQFTNLLVSPTLTNRTGNLTGPNGPNVVTYINQQVVGATTRDYVSVEGAGVFRTTVNGGVQSTWESVNAGVANVNPLPSLNTGGVSFDATAGVNKFFVRVPGFGLYESTDPATNGWTLSAGGDTKWANGGTEVVSSTEIYQGGRAGIYKFDNGTWSWLQGGGLPAGYLGNTSTDAGNPQIVYAIAETVYKSTDGGATWVVSDNGITGPCNGGRVRAHPTSANQVYAGCDNTGLYQSPDGGATWSAINTGFPSTTAQDMDVSVDRNTSGASTTLYAQFGGGEGRGIWKSTNNGDTWTDITDGLSAVLTNAARNVSNLTIDPSNSSTLWASTGAGLYKSTNGGTNWAFQNLTGVNTVFGGQNAAAVDPANSNVVFLPVKNTNNLDVATSLSGLYRTLDGGATWQQILTNEKLRSGRLIRNGTNLVFWVVTDGHFNVPMQYSAGVYLCSDVFADQVTEMGCRQQARGLSNVNTVILEANHDRTRVLRASTEGGGVFDFRRVFLGPDFNNDGYADILWRNILTGDDFIWMMRGLGITQSGATANVNAANWAIAGTGDFNGDGFTDLLWRNSVSGDNAIWLMDRNTVFSGALIAGVPASWNVVGVGDFDGDGRSDILWREPGAGNNAIWMMNGFAVASGALIPGVPAAAPGVPGWTVAGVGDFNNDGKSDILWRNTATGDNAIWMMNGFAVASGALIPGVSAALPWILAGLGDFNNDGKSDILWHNTASGDNAIWLMNGSAVASAALINSVPDTNWTIAAVGDYNGDYMSDILWRNSTLGTNYTWSMNGFTLQSACGTMGCISGYIPGVSAVGWSIINTR